MSEYSALCPGYKHVQAFGPDDEYEDDEEEVAYITLDLGNADPALIPSSSNYRLIGLDTPTPFLQLSGTIFKGRHDSLLGTELLFTEGKDTGDWSKRSITHVANTEQRICFKEVQLKPKKVPEQEEGGADGVQTQGLQLDRITGKIGPAPRPPPKPRKEKKKKEKTEAEKVQETGTEEVQRATEENGVAEHVQEAVVAEVAEVVPEEAQESATKIVEHDRQMQVDS